MKIKEELKLIDKKYCIYTISDPISNKVIYVGQTSRFQKRVWKHRSPSLKDPSDICCYLRGLRDNKLSPIIEIIDDCEKENRNILERYWISQFKAWGFKLLNRTDGGATSQGYRRTYEENIRVSRIIGNQIIYLKDRHSGKTLKEFKSLREATLFIKNSNISKASEKIIAGEIHRVAYKIPKLIKSTNPNWKPYICISRTAYGYEWDGKKLTKNV